jgi:uncharacterized protein (TIGR00288 family)
MSLSGDVRSTTAKNLAVFIDADNLNDPTALDHVLHALRTVADRVIYRRAYGRPESLKGIEAVLWRHGVRPVANLIVDKVTTDSALVIDAVEAVCTNKIDVVAICSGDADFVPLVTWLREKGCHVICYSLSNKLFANAESFYDEVILLDVVEKPKSVVPLALPVTPTVKPPAPSLPSPSATSASREGKLSVSVLRQGVTSKGPSLKDILYALPELKSCELVHLSAVAKKLRDAGLLAKTASSAVLFRRYPAQFELTPTKQPNAVRYRAKRT